MTCDDVWAFPLYLHETVAVVHKCAACDLLEGLADVRQRLGLLDQGLVVVDQRQSHAEQDFGPLVEQAIPHSQNRLQGGKQALKKNWPATVNRAVVSIRVLVGGVGIFLASPPCLQGLLPSTPSVFGEQTRVFAAGRPTAAVLGVSASQITAHGGNR